MRHNKKGRKLGTDWSHSKAMKRSLVSALFLNDRIKTIEMRAKEIRPDVDRIITWAKRGDLHSRRLAIGYLNDQYLVAEIFEKVEQGMFKDRPGGYTRIMKLGNRKGDNAPMVIMELVSEPVRFKADRKAAAEAKANKNKKKKAAPKKVEKDTKDTSGEETASDIEELSDETAEDKLTESATEAENFEQEAADEVAEEAEEATEAAEEATEAEAEEEATEAQADPDEDEAAAETIEEAADETEGEKAE